MNNLTSRQRLYSRKEDGLPTQKLSPRNNGHENTTRLKRHSSTVLNNPMIAILRKSFRLLTTRNAQDNPSTHKNPFIDLIIDILIGTATGVLFILFLSLLDYRSIITFRRSHSRIVAAADELLTDPEWMQSIQDTMDVKFLDADIYNAIQREIVQKMEIANDGISENEENIKASKQLRDVQSELEVAMKEYADVKAEIYSKFGASLDLWCGDCNAGFGNCDDRVWHVRNKYGTRERLAKLTLMSEGKCMLQLPEIPKGIPKLGASLDLWCGDCNAGFGNCDGRVWHLRNKYGTRERLAKLTIMSEGKCMLQLPEIPKGIPEKKR